MTCGSGVAVARQCLRRHNSLMAGTTVGGRRLPVGLAERGAVALRFRIWRQHKGGLRWELDREASKRLAISNLPGSRGFRPLRIRHITGAMRQTCFGVHLGTAWGPRCRWTQPCRHGETSGARPRWRGSWPCDVCRIPCVAAGSPIFMILVALPWCPFSTRKGFTTHRGQVYIAWLSIARDRCAYGSLCRPVKVVPCRETLHADW
mmetsp:Transcript_31459/g.83821  ORF Transcript_31459/g.83821 Transcript_31459/m.83821 type:complete len:205 (-) Transcript_31459:525-1139(-)